MNTNPYATVLEKIRDNLLVPMHDSLKSNATEQYANLRAEMDKLHDEQRRALFDAKNETLASFANAAEQVRWLP